jgi:hypothetical protein
MQMLAPTMRAVRSGDERSASGHWNSAARAHDKAAAHYEDKDKELAKYHRHMADAAGKNADMTRW